VTSPQAPENDTPLKVILAKVKDNDRKLKLGVEAEIRAEKKKAGDTKSMAEITDEVIDARFDIIDGKQLRDLTEGEVFFLLNYNTPRDELYVGNELLKRIYVAEGIEGLITAVQIIHTVMLRDNELKMYDFSDPKKELHEYLPYFQTIGPISTLLHSRRQFGLESAATVVGLSFMAFGGLNLANNILQSLTEEKVPVEEKPPEGMLARTKRVLGNINDKVNDFGYPTAEIIGGGIGTTLGVALFRKEMLEQVQNGVSEMVKHEQKAPLIRQVEVLLEFAMSDAMSGPQREAMCDAFNHFLKNGPFDVKFKVETLVGNESDIADEIIKQYHTKPDPLEAFLTDTAQRLGKGHPIRKFVRPAAQEAAL